jgi:hypothetical protein
MEHPTAVNLAYSSVAHSDRHLADWMAANSANLKVVQKAATRVVMRAVSKAGSMASHSAA